jgi:hypothetical protein
MPEYASRALGNACGNVLVELNKFATGEAIAIDKIVNARAEPAYHKTMNYSNPKKLESVAHSQSKIDD